VNEPEGVTSKGRGAKRTALRVALIVFGALVLLTVVKVASVGLQRFKQAGGPSSRSSISVLESNAANLRHFGFAGCPTVQQVLELTPEPARTDMRLDTNGIDPWGTPYQVECDHQKVHVFSMGPDKQAGTADDIRWNR
jgi:type II secretion system (T2SS) protein G